MSKAVLLNENLERAEEISLPVEFSEINSHNLYLYNKSYLASVRSNTAISKTRSDVTGGGKKPWAQKGRGGARAGSITSPVFVGGGVAHGAKSRNYTLKVNKKQRALALKYVINAQGQNGALFVVNSINIESGKTKDAVKFLSRINSKKTLIVVDEINENTYLAFRNLKNAYLIKESLTLI
jgi:large subunit ribosomal protein L4